MKAGSPRAILLDEPTLKLPPAFYRLQAFVSDHPRADPAASAAMIAADAAAARWVQQYAGSALFEGAAAATLADAVARIGTRQLADVALAGAAFAALKGIQPDIVTAKSFWTHSLACGVAAREIALLRGDDNAETCFAAGVLHDAGSLLFYTHISDGDLIRILHRRNSEVPLYQIERDILHFDHADLGCALLKNWGAPPEVAAAVAFHHDPERATDYRLTASVVHIADIMVNAMGFGSRGQHRVPPLAGPAWERLGLQLAQLPELLVRIDRKTAPVLALFLENNYSESR